jgi:hypothetical protein
MKNGRCKGLLKTVDERVDARDESRIMVLQEHQVMRIVQQIAASLSLLPGDTGDWKRLSGEPGVEGVHHEIRVEKTRSPGERVNKVAHPKNQVVNSIQRANEVIKMLSGRQGKKDPLPGECYDDAVKEH